MRHWGIAITVFYALAVAGLLLPAAYVLHEESWPSSSLLQELYTDWILWFWVAILAGGQALLLFLSVDSSHRFLKRRLHIAVSVTLAGVLISLLTVAAITSLIAAMNAEAGNNQTRWVRHLFPFDSVLKNILAWVLTFWIIWTGLFYLYFRNSSKLVNRLTTWLLRGSVLELLIAVPCHLIVRQRDECTNPVVTSFGVVTGVAIMLLAFGPSVLLLYKRRLNQYR